jgi:hypothetical protein
MTAKWVSNGDVVVETIAFECLTFNVAVFEELGRVWYCKEQKGG